MQSERRKLEDLLRHGCSKSRAAFEPPGNCVVFPGRANSGRCSKVSFDDVVHPLKAVPYDPLTLRTLFRSLEDSSWET